MPTNQNSSGRPERLDHGHVSAQFNHLIEELIAGKIERGRFETWEVDILLDVLGCSLRRFTRPFVLRQYQKAVQQQLENGATVPMRLSQFLESRAKTVAAKSESPSAARTSRVLKFGWSLKLGVPRANSALPPLT